MQRSHPQLRWSLCALAVLIVSSFAHAQSGTAYKPSRMDLATAYARLDGVLASHPPAIEDIAEINQAFDRVTLAFFRGGFDQTLEQCNELLLSIMFGETTTLNDRAALAHHIRVQPRVIVIGQSAPPQVIVSRMYPTGAADADETVINLRFVTATQEVLAEQQIAIEDGANRFVWDLPLDHHVLDRGRYVIEVRIGPDRWLPACAFYVSDETMADLRRRNSVALDAIDTEARKQLAQAIAACRSRNGLLLDAPRATSSAHSLFDPVQLAAEVESEIKSLQEGIDPYHHRRGDLWRTVSLESVNLPVRLHVPASYEAATPMPLIIAMHGAGGDENMFAMAYGGGAITRLAEESGFIVAAPLTYMMISQPGALDRLIDQMQSDYTINEDRIYLIGHSLGAMAATSFATTHADKIAAVCAIAGGGRFGGDPSMAPVLCIAAEHDPLMSARAMEADVRAAALNSQLPVSYMQLRHYGHTLVVGPALPIAIDWLFHHARRTAKTDVIVD